MPTIRNTRLVYSTDPDVEVEPRRKKKQKKPSGKPAPKLPNDGVIRVFLERKGRKGKSVTVLRGLSGSESDRKALLKQLKSKLGTGGALKDGAIEIQGDHRDRVIAILDKLGYKAKKAGG
jgi:translation initiation factor 1